MTSFLTPNAAFSRNTGYYFRDEEDMPKKNAQQESKSGLLTPPKTSDADINPYAFAMASIYNRSHPNSRSHTPSHSRAASVHREPSSEQRRAPHTDDKELNPYAYAMGEIYRHSRSRSVTPAHSRAASVHNEESAPVNEKKGLAKFWRNSFSKKHDSN